LNTHNSDVQFSENPDPMKARRVPVPLHELLGVRIVVAENGRGQVALTVSEMHLRTFGMLHGGVMATLLDASMGIAAMTRAPVEHDVVTVQLNVNFIRPAWERETLSATGEILHSGRRTAVARGEIRTAEGALVASGTATFMFVPLSDPAHQSPVADARAKG
jgi:acyl-CoA thioesterase